VIRRCGVRTGWVSIGTTVGVRDGNGTGGGTRTGSAGGGTDLAGLVGATGSVAGDAELKILMQWKGIDLVFMVNFLNTISRDP
jgi:hypothetical protein